MVFPSQWCKIGLALPLPPAFSGLFPGSGRLKPLIFDLRGEPVPEEFRLSGGFSIRATQGGKYGGQHSTHSQRSSAASILFQQ
jgi:hypothetical protein